MTKDDNLLLSVTRIDALLILAGREVVENEDADLTALDALVSSARLEVGVLCSIINQEVAA